jgi:hypothetical protein
MSRSVVKVFDFNLYVVCSGMCWRKIMCWAQRQELGVASRYVLLNRPPAEKIKSSSNKFNSFSGF